MLVLTEFRVEIYWIWLIAPLFKFYVLFYFDQKRKLETTFMVKIREVVLWKDGDNASWELGHR